MEPVERLEEEVVRLHHVGGMDRLSGWDQFGRHWIECWPDYGIPNCGAVRCSLCGKMIAINMAGWICPESGEVLCDDHLVY